MFHSSKNILAIFWSGAHMMSIMLSFISEDSLWCCVVWHMRSLCEHMNSWLLNEWACGSWDTLCSLRFWSLSTGWAEQPIAAPLTTGPRWTCRSLRDCCHRWERYKHIHTSAMMDWTSDLMNVWIFVSLPWILKSREFDGGTLWLGLLSPTRTLSEFYFPKMSLYM